MKRYYTANMHLHMWATLGQCFPFTLDIWMASLCVLWSIFQHDNAQQPALAARIRPISSPRLLNIHPRSSTRPDNKQEARGLNAWVGRGGGQRGRRKGGGGGGQIPAKVGGKQPVSKVTSPASVLCSSLWEKGEGRQEGFFLFSFFPPFLFFWSVLVGKTWVAVYWEGQVSGRASQSFSPCRRTGSVRRKGIIISKYQQPWMWGETRR